MKRVLLLFAVLTITNILNKSVIAQTTPWPDWVFKHWVWEDASTQQSAMQLLDDYEVHNIPVGVINIDSRWDVGYGTFQVDTALFPNVQAMIDSIHARNIKVIFWTTSAIDTDVHELWHYADSMGYFMKTSAGSGSAIIHWWKGDGSMIDFFNPAAVTWWKALMDKVLDLGIDGWKCDGTDYSILLANATYSPGMGAAVTRLQYSHAYYHLFYDYTRQRLGNDRAIMSRPIDNYGYTFITDPNLVSFTPREIGFACWVGDQDGTFDGMKKALNNMYQSNVNNYLAFGSDIGGYRTDNAYPVNGRSKELFVRWAQLGAFSPLMENGGGGEHRPWMFDQQTNDIYNKFARLHHAMVPYLMHQGDSLFAVTQSLMQFFNSTDYSFMLGSDIFVVPMLSSSNSITIDFPAGDWTYLFNNAQVYSGSANSLNIPLGEFPVFIKSGSPLLAILDSVINSVTGVENIIMQNNTVTLYPNPATEQVHISGLEFNAGEEYEFHLFDVLGRDLQKTHLSSEKANVSIAGFENGVYYYTIENSALSTPKKISGKVVIQK